MKKTLLRLTISLFFAGFAAGCTTPPTAADQAEADLPLFCTGPDQCALYWKRAQLWVVQNSAFKLQLATDVVIQTYSPPEASPLRAYMITREPMANGQERIWITSGCRNLFGCTVSTQTAAAAFKRFVRSAPQPP